MEVFMKIRDFIVIVIVGLTLPMALSAQQLTEQEYSNVGSYMKQATAEKLAASGMLNEARIRNEKEEALFKKGYIIARKTEYSSNIDKWFTLASSEDLSAAGMIEAAEYRLAREIREMIYNQNKSKYTVLTQLP